MKVATFALAAACVLSPFSAAGVLAQTDVTGDWELTIQSMQGTSTAHATFKQDGEKVSGTLRSPMGELRFDGGSMIGDELKFVFTVPFQGQPIEITITGRVDGPSITGKAQFGGIGEGEWHGKRVETSAAATTATATSAETASAAATLPGPAGAPPAETGTGLSGTWDFTVKTQMGDLPASVELSESEGKISGTLTGPTGAMELSGTLDGSTVKLAFVAKTPNGDIPVSMTGELHGDSIINGKAEFGATGQGEWSAKRKP